MTIRLRWPLRVLAVMLSPFALLAVGRIAFWCVEAFALWLGLSAEIAEFCGSYIGVMAGGVTALGMIIGAFHVWRPDKAGGDQ